MTSPSILEPFIPVRTEMYKHYRNHTLVGKALLESLNDMVSSGDLTKQVAFNLLQQFDYQILKYVRIGRGTRIRPENDRPAVTFESSQLLSYRHHSSESGNGQMWQLLFKDVDVNLEFQPNVVKSFVSFSKYERGDNPSPTRVQKLKSKKRKEKREKQNRKFLKNCSSKYKLQSKNYWEGRKKSKQSNPDIQKSLKFKTLDNEASSCNALRKLGKAQGIHDWLMKNAQASSESAQPIGVQRRSHRSPSPEIVELWRSPKINTFYKDKQKNKNGAVVTNVSNKTSDIKIEYPFDLLPQLDGAGDGFEETLESCQRSKKFVATKSYDDSRSNKTSKQKIGNYLISTTVEMNLPYLLIIAYSPFFHRPITQISASDLVMHQRWWCKPLTVDVNTNPRIEYVEFKRVEKRKALPKTEVNAKDRGNEIDLHQKFANIPHRVRSSNMYKESCKEKYKEQYDPLKSAKKLGASARRENLKFCGVTREIDIEEKDENEIAHEYYTRRSQIKVKKTPNTSRSDEKPTNITRTNKVVHNILQSYSRKQDTNKCDMKTTQEKKYLNDAKVRINHSQKIGLPKSQIKSVKDKEQHPYITKEGLEHGLNELDAKIGKSYHSQYKLSEQFILKDQLVSAEKLTDVEDKSMPSL